MSHLLSHRLAPLEQGSHSFRQIWNVFLKGLFAFDSKVLMMLMSYNKLVISDGYVDCNCIDNFDFFFSFFLDVGESCSTAVIQPAVCSRH